MATRSNIAVQFPNGEIRMIYVHFDGYPSHNGKILIGHYNNQKAAEELVSAGDMSSLAATLKQCKLYNEKYEKIHGDPRFLRCREEYLYVWHSGKWYVKHCTNVAFTELMNVI